MKSIFIHIPKTAGTTLQELILKNNSRQDVSHIKGLDTLEVEHILHELSLHKMIFGHFRFMEEFRTHDRFLFTFLRDPMDRCISNFFHYKRQGHYAKAPIIEQMEIFLSDEDLLENGNFNMQTHFMAGLVKQKDFMAEPQKYLEIAKKNLDKLDFVGISEYFEPSAYMLCAQLEWDKWYYIKHNLGSGKHIKSKLLDKFGDRLKEINKADIELYEYGLGIFEKQTQQIPVPAMKKWKARGLSFLKTAVKKTNI